MRRSRAGMRGIKSGMRRSRAGHDGEWGRAVAHIEDSFCKFKIKHYLCGPKIYVDRFGLLATTLKNAKITFHISVLCF